MYIVETRGLFGGWERHERSHFNLESSLTVAEKLVKNGKNPNHVRVIKVVAEFEPQYSIKAK